LGLALPIQRSVDEAEIFSHGSRRCAFIFNSSMSAIHVLELISHRQLWTYYMQDPNKIAKTKRGPLLYNINDTRVGRALEVYGEWGESEFEVFEQILKPGDSVVDAGAYIGTHTLYFSQKVGSQGCVFAFEPQKIPFQLLCRNIALNSLTNVKPLQAALGEKRGSVNVARIDFQRAGDFAAYSASYVLKSGEQSDTVPALSLDDCEIPACKLLKVDADGDELAILSGAKKFLRRTRSIVFVENNIEKKSGELIKLLLSLDYTLYWHLDFAFRKGNFAQDAKDIFDGAFDVNLLGIPSEVKASLSNFTSVTGPEDSWQAALERSRAN